MQTSSWPVTLREYKLILNTDHLEDRVEDTAVAKVIKIASLDRLHLGIRLKQLLASKRGWKAPEDWERALQAYAHSTNFINSYRSK